MVTWQNESVRHRFGIFESGAEFRRSMGIALLLSLPAYVVLILLAVLAS